MTAVECSKSTNGRPLASTQLQTQGTKRVATEANAATTTSATGTQHGVNVSAHGAVSHKKRRTQKKIPKQHRVGNFRSYYNFRLGQHDRGGLEEDPRVSVLRHEWFDGKRGLDIGCNSGDMTITIAKRFTPAYIMGVDVDPQLISRARGQLKDIMHKEKVEAAFQSITPRQAEGGQNTGKPMLEGSGDASPVKEATAMSAPSVRNEPATFGDEMPLSFQLWKPPPQANTSAPQALGKASLGSKFPYNVVFKREDAVKDQHAAKDYDFITCFSVTKWIHLFHGDEGIQKLFRDFFALLAPGGRLLLEPQPWKSYHKRKFTSEITAANYGAIQLRPKDFPSYLVDTVGFRSCTFLQVCQTSNKGFRRPMYVVEK